MSLIISTKIIESTIQAEGIQRVQIAFVNHLNCEHRRQYDFAKDAIIADEIEIRKSHIEQGLKDQDVELAVGRIESDKSFKLQYASEDELKLRLQEREVENQEEIDMLISKKANIAMALEAK